VFIDTCDYLAFCLLDCRPPRDRVSDWTAKKNFSKASGADIPSLAAATIHSSAGAKEEKAPRPTSKRTKAEAEGTASTTCFDSIQLVNSFVPQN
jgi:hypothetical protein